MARLGSIPVSQDVNVAGSTDQPANVLSPSPTIYETLPRANVMTLPSTSNLLLNGKQLMGMYFTATRSGTINDIRFAIGSSSPISGSTLVKAALYVADTNDDLTLVKASDPMATTYVASAEAVGTLPGGAAVTAGQRYAMVMLSNQGSGFNVLGGLHPLGLASPMKIKPRMVADSSASTYTDIPATFPVSAMNNANSQAWIWIYGTGT
jgi:hypothetical protein